eukprot:Selendium_serpulae@DN3547_c0_g1_i2.p1
MFDINEDTGSIVRPTIDNFKLKSSSTPSAKSTQSLSCLSTAISSIAVHESGELMAVGSRFKPKSLKMIHLESKTIFANWPAKTSLGYVSALAFGKSGHFAIGQEDGKIHTFQLSHFS